MEAPSSRHPVDDWVPGGTYGLCDRCGFKYRLHDLRKEWTGLLTCEADWDPRPPQLDPPNIYPEGLPVRNARPDPGDTLGPNLTTAADL